MTYDFPKERWGLLVSKIIVGMFLLIVGAMVNQFWNIPIQQVRQDDRLNNIEKHMEYNDQRLDKFQVQHEIIARQLDYLTRLHEEKYQRIKQGTKH